MTLCDFATLSTALKVPGTKFAAFVDGVIATLPPPAACPPQIPKSRVARPAL